MIQRSNLVIKLIKGNSHLPLENLSIPKLLSKAEKPQPKTTDIKTSALFGLATQGNPFVPEPKNIGEVSSISEIDDEPKNLTFKNSDFCNFSRQRPTIYQIF